MNYENVDTGPSLQMHMLPSVCPFVCVWGGGGGGGGQGTFSRGEVGYTLRKGQHSLYP